MRKTIGTIAAAAAALVLTATGAHAAVTIDPTTGIGFVGKGDVQLAYGWDNATLQANAANVDFGIEQVDEYDVTCEFETERTDVSFVGEGRDKIRIVQTVRITHTTFKDLSTSVNRDLTTRSRKNPQGAVTGFNVTGVDGFTESGDEVPDVGDACLGNGEGTIDPHITAVELVSSTSGVYVTNAGSNKVALN